MTPQAGLGQARSLSLVLPGFVPDSRLSLNGRHRTHWTVLRRLRDETAWRVMQALGMQIMDPLPARAVFTERVSCAVTFVYPIHRRRDPDGLAGLAKPLLDALVRCLVLTDDDSEHVVLAVSAIVEPKTTETRIEITELES